MSKCEESFCSLIGQTSRAIARRIHRNWRVAGSDVTLEQWSVMTQLWEKDGRSQQDICVCTDRDKPCMTRLIDTMEKHDLVVRIPDKDDRRVKLIYLTHKGKEIQKLLTEQVIKSVDEALEGIEDHELEICKQILRRICDNLSDE